MVYLAEAQASGSWYRRNQRSRHSWTRFDLPNKVSIISIGPFSFAHSQWRCEFLGIFSVLTFWDLLETLINGSHDCGFD